MRWPRRAGFLLLAAWIGYVTGYRKRETDEHRERERQFYADWPRDAGRGGGFWDERRMR